MPEPRFHPIMDSLRKDQLDANLHEGKLRIENSWFEEDSPLDLSEEFSKLCLACRTGDLKSCQELITDGVSINAHDQFDYTPLILVRLTFTSFFNRILILDLPRPAYAAIMRLYNFYWRLAHSVCEILSRVSDVSIMP